MKTKKRLSQKAMLVNFQISGWTGRVKDKAVSREITVSKKAEQDSGAWWTYLVPRSVLKELENSRNKARNMHYALTLPWQDGGCRILPSAMFLDYTKAIREVTEDYDRVVQNFLNIYPTLVAESKKRLGDLAINKTYPSVESISNKFKCHQSIFPLPDVKDFRVDLSEDDADTIRKQVEDSITATTQKAMQSVWDKFTDLVDKIESTLKQPKKVFRDTLISNLSDFCELLPKMNLTDDDNLETIRKEVVDKLADLKPNDLRESKKDRTAAVKAAKEVLKKMKGYV